MIEILYACTKSSKIIKFKLIWYPYRTYVIAKSHEINKRKSMDVYPCDPVLIKTYNH